ncbi:hypothetical protein V8F20_003617 [Naviculisporaceae sp. PSN 640]
MESLPSSVHCRQCRTDRTIAEAELLRKSTKNHRARGPALFTDCLFLGREKYHTGAVLSWHSSLRSIGSETSYFRYIVLYEHHTDNPLCSVKPAFHFFDLVGTHRICHSASCMAPSTINKSLANYLLSSSYTASRRALLFTLIRDGFGLGCTSCAAPHAHATISEKGVRSMQFHRITEDMRRDLRVIDQDHPSRVRPLHDRKTCSELKTCIWDNIPACVNSACLRHGLLDQG